MFTSPVIMSLFPAALPEGSKITDILCWFFSSTLHAEISVDSLKLLKILSIESGKILAILPMQLIIKWYLVCERLILLQLLLSYTIIILLPVTTLLVLLVCFESYTVVLTS